MVGVSNSVEICREPVLLFCFLNTNLVWPVVLVLTVVPCKLLSGTATKQLGEQKTRGDPE